MSSSFSVGGLMTGLDTGSIVSQLMAIERQPVTRLQNQIKALNSQKSAIGELRTQLQTLRAKIQDFRLLGVFSQYTATTSDNKVLTASISGPNPVVGSYAVNVTQMASATVATGSSAMGQAINPGAVLSSSGMTTAVTAGTFTINGVSITVDPATQTLNQVLTAINASGAGVTASYNALTDKITFENSTPGNTAIINFGADDDTSNFLSAIHVTEATQSTSGGGSTVATSTRNLGAIDSAKLLNQVSFANGAITAGTFKINGVTISVDPAADTMLDVVQRINDSGAQVSASYDGTTDSLRFVAKTLGSRTISFTAGTSNFLSVTNLVSPTQTAGSDVQFTINGGPVQTRNTNEVSDAIGGVTLRLLSTGTSTVTIAADDDKIVESVNSFITSFNESVDKIVALTAKDGTLANDATIKEIKATLQTLVFGSVSGISGSYKSLIDLGITTGDTFDAGTTSHLQLKEDTLREALRTARLNVQNVFYNTGTTGVADQLYAYLDSITKVGGFLNDRAKSNGSIDRQVQDINARIDRLNASIAKKETRLKKQFAALEQFSSQMQSQSTAITALSKYDW
ncbi:MAG TPA: flagellar filament capping protein FliD [Candidatus Hydrogenedentes bacterium]|nr:flagellar filament capping protein FliD [Candidatus Hydrogenedentota bacterium]HRT20562.1 flagellar filament capping protein FliD [Candidatus Hydrogenedentota bacterium]HRT65233.1 flagellar filament capping protein FliD [Candidatus Hydrogenedentota bacterium]